MEGYTLGNVQADIVQTTISTSLRINESTYDYIRKKASDMNISQNAFINVLINLGIKAFEILPQLSVQNSQYPLK